MSEYAPKTLFDTYARVKLASKRLSGILGNAAHVAGYHRSRNALLAAGRTMDYSVVLRLDKGGDGDAACAMDITLNAADMKLATDRLFAAIRNNDPRMAGVRAVNGTRDGEVAVRYDRHDPSTPADDAIDPASEDHVWHVHIEWYRSMCTDRYTLPVADVINGVPLASAPHLRRPWPAYMPAGHYFGLITGPARSHGGYYASERPDVMAIQARLRMFGNPATQVAVDGKFGPSTAAAVAWWQKARVPSTPAVDLGRLDAVAWTRLFTY